MATIAGLVVEISANARKFHSAVNDIKSRATKFARQLKTIIGAAVKTVVAGATAAAAAVTATVTQTSLAMRDLVRDAEAVGTTARDLQTWQYAAQSMGVEADKVGDIMKDLQDKVGDFVRTGGGEAADVFEQLGLNAQEFIGLAPDQALLRIGSALEGLSQGEKIFFMESIADDASRLLPLLDDNAERFKALTQQGKEWGTIMTDAEIQASAALGKTLGNAGKMATGFKNLLGANLAPTFQGIIEWVQSIADSFGGPRKAAERMAEGIEKAMIFIANAASGLVRVFKLAANDGVIAFYTIRGAVAELAESIYSGPIDAVNFLIQQWNRIPGMDLGDVEQPDFVKSIQSDLDGVQKSLEDAKKKRDDLLMKPLAGDAFASFIGGGEGGNTTPSTLMPTNDQAGLAEGSRTVSEALEDQTEATEDSTTAIKDFSDAAARGARSIASAVGSLTGAGKDPRYSLDPDEGTFSSRARERFEASAFRIGDPETINYAANPSAKPTWSTAAYDAAGSASSAAASGIMGGTSSRMGGGKHLGTLTLSSEKGGQLDVEANEDQLGKWLSDTLTKTAGAV